MKKRGTAEQSLDAVLRHLEAAGQAEAEEIAEKIGFSRKHVMRLFGKLKKEGKVRVIKKASGERYTYEFAQQRNRKERNKEAVLSYQERQKLKEREALEATRIAAEYFDKAARRDAAILELA